jgi:hypothetical protein
MLNLWKSAFEEAIDALAEIPHPMAEEAIERLLEDYPLDEEIA